MAYTEEELKKELETKEYEYGFYTTWSDTLPKGLNEELFEQYHRRRRARMDDYLRLDAFAQ